MSKIPSLLTVASGYLSTQQINANFDTIVNAFQNTLSLDGSLPNTMNADLDMNNFKILNANIDTSSILTFTNIAVSGQGTISALTTEDTLTLQAGANVTLTTNPTTKTLTITSATTGGATLADGDYGDIVVSSSGTVISIDTGVVTLAKMANMATSSLIYRKTGGSGAPEVNSLATLKTDLGLTGTNSGDQTITLTGNVTGSGTGSIAATIGAGQVTEAMLSTSDVTTANSTTSKHGFLKKLDNTATHYMDGTGNWSTPPSGTPVEVKTTATGSTSYVLTVDFTTYSAYRIYISNISDGLGTGSDLTIEGSQDGGSNYRTTTYAGYNITGLSVSNLQGTASTGLASDSTSGNQLIIVDIVQPNLTSNTNFINSCSNYPTVTGGNIDSSAALNRIRFKDAFSTSFSCVFSVIPMAKR